MIINTIYYCIPSQSDRDLKGVKKEDFAVWGVLQGGLQVLLRGGLRMGLQGGLWGELQEGFQKGPRAWHRSSWTFPHCIWPVCGYTRPRVLSHRGLSCCTRGLTHLEQRIKTFHFPTLQLNSMFFIRYANLLLPDPVKKATSSLSSLTYIL